MGFIIGLLIGVFVGVVGVLVLMALSVLGVVG